MESESESEMEKENKSLKAKLSENEKNFSLQMEKNLHAADAYRVFITEMEVSKVKFLSIKIIIFIFLW